MGAVRECGAIHTEGDWFAGGGSWVAAANPINGDISGSDDVDYYGGHLIGESISSCNIPIISAAPDMFKALLAVKQKLHFLGMPGEKVCKVTGKSDWSDEIKLIEAALTKAVTRVPVPEKVAPAAPSVCVGEGWRVIGDDETLIAGDEYWNRVGDYWEPVHSEKGKQKQCSSLKWHRVRRRIVNDGELVDAGFEVLEQPNPPLGLMPRQIWLENRRDDIYDAIARYRAPGKGVSRDWLNELLDLDNEMRPF